MNTDEKIDNFYFKTAFKANFITDIRVKQYG